MVAILLVEVSELRTHTTRIFRVGIDSKRIVLSLYSDACHAVRSHNAFWDTDKYRVHVQHIELNSVFQLEHEQVLEDPLDPVVP